MVIFAQLEGFAGAIHERKNPKGRLATPFVRGLNGF
jgi:hypothetical protein